MITELENLQKKLDSQDIEITIDDLVQWKDHPVTRYLCATILHKYLQGIETLTEDIPYNDEARAAHASNVGRMDVYKFVLDYVEDEKEKLRENNNDD